MAEKLKIPISPGGLLSDVVEIGGNAYQHQKVTNLRHTKKGLWETVQGYIELFTHVSYTDIKAAIEINDEYSGDRFILFQNGTHIYRIDYDDGDGNGYENETPVRIFESGVTISGVTIGATTTIRFFYFRGVVRITGPSAPLWYGYIDRELFPNSLEVVEDDESFESDVGGWAGTSATLSQDNTYTIGALGSNSLKILQTGADGVGKKSYTVVIGETYYLHLMMYKVSGGNDPTLKVGSTDGASDYLSHTFTETGIWVGKGIEIVATSTTIYIEINPAPSSNSEELHVDFVRLTKYDSITLADWSLVKAEVTAQTFEYLNDYIIEELGGGSEQNSFVKAYSIFDEGQYSLLADIDPDYEICPNTQMDMLFYTLRIPGADLITTFIHNRLTGLGVCLYNKARDFLPYDEDDAVFIVSKVLDFTDEMKSISYVRQNLYYDNTKKHTLNFTSSGSWHEYDGFLYLNAIVKLENGVGSITTRVISIATDDGEPVSAEILFADPIYPHLKSADTSGALPDTTVTIYRKWQYDATNGIWTNLSFHIDNLPTTDPYTAIDIASGTDDTNPDYSHRAIIEDRAYCASNEDEEEDVVRYSPLNQFDVFPNGNIIQTEVGDVDANKAIVKLGNRLIMLKSKSFSQGNFVGSSYYEDIGIAKKGLYPDTYGFIALESDLFFMDVNDVNLFNGVQLNNFLEKTGIRRLYANNVNTSSFFIYDKLNNELWLVLSGIILVYQFDKNEWYVRDTDITPLGHYLDVNNNLVVFSSTKFCLFNHDEDTFDEDVGFEVITKVFDLETPEFYKKASRMITTGQGSPTVKVSLQDFGIGDQV